MGIRRHVPLTVTNRTRGQRHNLRRLTGFNLTYNSSPQYINGRDNMTRLFANINRLHLHHNRYTLTTTRHNLNHIVFTLTNMNLKRRFLLARGNHDNLLSPHLLNSRLNLNQVSTNLRILKIRPNRRLLNNRPVASVRRTLSSLTHRPG